MKYRLPKIIIFVFLVLILILFLGQSKSQAGTLLETALRLNRLKATTATGGMVCAKTPALDNGTEGRIKITFPSGFTVNSTASNWTVTTTNILSGATAWPGIGTAVTVSGKNVIFPSSDLSSNTLYCFNFADSNTLTTSTTGPSIAVVETMTAGGATIDTNTVGLSIVSDDGIVVSATVPASPTDFQADLTQTTTGTQFPENTTLSYQINYGSSLTYASNITVEAQWSLGTITGSGSPSVEVLDYVVGSASNGYNSTPPVIDLTNRKITWTISSFPASTTNQTVTFELRSTNSYTGSSVVGFDVMARVLGPGTTTPDSTVSKTYRHSSATPTAAPTPKPDEYTGVSDGQSDGRSDGKSSKLQEVSQKPPTFYFSNISVNTVSKSDATLSVTTPLPASLQFRYGTSISNISKTITSLNLEKLHFISLDNLTPNTNYYFRLTAIDADGRKINSDIFTFRTATESVAPEVDHNSIIITNDSNVIFANNPASITSTKTKIPATIVIPHSTSYEFRFSLKKHDSVKDVHAYIKNRNVLGINNIEPIALKSDNIKALEVESGVFVGRLVSQKPTGFYDLSVKIKDYNGNIVEQKIVSVKVVEPLRIFSKKSNLPIEDAKINLSIYNERSKTYESISPQIINIKNPSYSDHNGIADITLPKGKYQAEISALGYNDQTVEFEIDLDSDNIYPQILLEDGNFNPITLFIYYIKILKDLYSATAFYINNLSLSVRFFDLISVVSMALLAIVALLAFSLKTHIKIRTLPIYIVNHVKELLGHERSKRYIFGEIMDESTGKPVTQAQIHLIDALSNSILSNASTNKLGEFFLPIKDAKGYKITITKKGYQPSTFLNYSKEALLISNLQFVILKTGETIPVTPITLFREAVENVTGFLFELFLVLSLIFEMLFLKTAGSFKTLPFIIVSILTILLWLSYAHRKVRRIAEGR